MKTWRAEPEPDPPAPEPEEPASMFSSLWGQLGDLAESLLHFSSATRRKESSEAEIERRERIGDIAVMQAGAERKAAELDARARRLEG